MKPTYVLIAIAAAALLMVAAPAQAIYIETPLNLGSDADAADVGDETGFTITPNPDNATYQDQWAGKTVKARYSYDKNEGPAGAPDDTASNDGYTEGDIGEVTLNDKANGSFSWTIPAEVDDHNVQVFLEDADGERLATFHLAVGDAEPMMYATGGNQGENPEIDRTNRDLQDEESEQESGEAAGIGMVGLLAALGIAGMGVLRRRD